MNDISQQNVAIGIEVFVRRDEKGETCRNRTDIHTLLLLLRLTCSEIDPSYDE